MAKKAPKRNPQDTTLRNNRARQKEIKHLRYAVLVLEQRLRAVEAKLGIVIE